MSMAEQNHDQDRVFELTSTLLDGGLEPTQVVELEAMLESSKAARQTYLGCVHLHVDLMDHFKPTEARTADDPFLTELFKAKRYEDVRSIEGHASKQDSNHCDNQASPTDAA